MRTCKKCGEEKSLDLFPKYKNANDKTYHRHSCKACFNAGVMDWQDKNPNAKHVSYVRRVWGLTYEQYSKLLSSGCEVCGSMESLQIDHDHSCCPSKTATCGNCIRGVLCRRHNLAEGLLNGNADEAIALAFYIAKNKKEVEAS